MTEKRLLFCRARCLGVRRLSSLQFCISAALILALALPGGAAIIRVRTDGSDSNNGLTWTSAKKTIHAAVASAGSGGEVWVAAGQYIDYISIGSISLYGGFAGWESVRAQRQPRANITQMDGQAINVLSEAGSDTVIDGFRFTANNGPGGIVCQPGSAPTISGNTFSKLQQSAIACYGPGSPVIVNNIVARSLTSAPAIRFEGASGSVPVVVNNTVVLNAGMGMSFGDARPVLHNNIVAFNVGPGIVASAGVSSAGNNCVYANNMDYNGLTPPEADISLDPVLPQAHNGDYHINANSPCRDAGDPFAPGVPMVDIDGQLRPFGALPDIGADESAGEVYGPAVVRVNASSTTNGPGDSWINAFRSLAQAISIASPGCEIWVAKGSYPEPLTIRPGVSLYGGFAGTEPFRQERRPRQNVSTISNAVTIPQPAGRTTVLDGFSLTGSSSPMVNCYGSAVVSGNILRPAYPGPPAGIYCHRGASPLIANNYITRVSTAVRLERSSAAVVHNSIIQCTGASGAALQADLSPDAPLPLVANNLIAFCASGVAVQGVPSIPLYHNCLYAIRGEVYSGTPGGATDMKEDPQLAGDFHIQPASPCVNRGANLADLGLGSLAEGTDLDGQHRVNGSMPDIGADESYGETLQPTAVRVRYNSNTSGPGTSWENAYRYIQQAAQEAPPGSEVWVAAGMYSTAVTVPDGVSLYGGFAGTEMSRPERLPLVNSTLMTSSSAPCFTFNPGAGRAMVVDGFTLASTSTYGAIRVSGASPTISGNVVFGGVIGISCTSAAAPLIVNNVITGCRDYGIMSSSSAPVIVNNTLAHIGTQSSMAAIYSLGMSPAKPVVANNIIAFNPCYAVRSVASSEPLLSHNCLWDNLYTYNWSPPRGVEINADPLMRRMGAGDYHIQPDSPCRNAGDSSVAGVPGTDMDGQRRPQGFAVDIGADESYGESYQPRVLRVRADSPADGPGDSWTTAYRSIHSALSAAAPGTEIWVAGGTYAEGVILESGIALYGGFTSTSTTRQDRNWRANQTVINGASCSTHVASNTVLDGFVLRYPCVIQAGSPTISRNVFRDADSPAVSCHAQSSPLIVANVITGRSGGIICLSTLGARIVGNTIVGNTVGSVPAIALQSSSPLIAGNIVAFNTAGISATGACSPTMAGNCVYGNTNGDYAGLPVPPGDLRADPLLTDMLHLSAASPCVGMAPAAYASLLPDTDIDGEARVQGDAADIGADECWLWADGIAQAKLSADAVAALIQGAVVTAAFDGLFYVEEDNRACGLRVEKAGHGLAAGMRADVSGAMATNAAGERCLLAGIARQNGTGEIAPLTMALGSTAGQDWHFNPVSGAGQRGVSGGLGLNPTGLLVRLAGRVESVDAGGAYLVLSDGSGVEDPDGRPGVRVQAAGIMPPGLAAGDFVTVTGISSCYKAGEDLYPQLLARSAEDIQAVSP